MKKFKTYLSNIIRQMFPRDNDKEYSWFVILGLLTLIGIICYLLIWLKFNPSSFDFDAILKKFFDAILKKFG